MVRQSMHPKVECHVTVAAKGVGVEGERRLGTELRIEGLRMIDMNGMHWCVTEGNVEKEHSGTTQAKAETGIV